MLDLKSSLKFRLKFLESKAQDGVIPGEQDTYELEQMIGRVKELKYVLELIEKIDNEIV
jgi:hypothetical protein